MAHTLSGECVSLWINLLSLYCGLLLNSFLHEAKSPHSLETWDMTIISRPIFFPETFSNPGFISIPDLVQRPLVSRRDVYVLTAAIWIQRCTNIISHKYKCILTFHSHLLPPAWGHRQLPGKEFCFLLFCFSMEVFLIAAPLAPRPIISTLSLTPWDT